VFCNYNFIHIRETEAYIDLPHKYRHTGLFHWWLWCTQARPTTIKCAHLLSLTLSLKKTPIIPNGNVNVIYYKVKSEGFFSVLLDRNDLDSSWNAQDFSLDIK